MPKFIFSVVDAQGGTTVSFDADDIWTVLNKFQGFLKVGGFEFVDEVNAVAYDPEDPDQDIYYFSDGEVALAKDLDAETVVEA